MTLVSVRRGIWVVAFCLAAHSSSVALELDITDGGANGANQLWNVTLSPDAASSAAVEIGLQFVGGEILAVTANEAVFDRMTAGIDPFIGGRSVGIVLHDTIPDDELEINDAAYAALGSIVLPTTDEVLVLTVETDALGTLSLGGHSHGGQYLGARVAQQGENFDGLTASLTLPGAAFAADFDKNGAVNALDIGIWETNFGAVADDATGDANGDGLADGADFLIWQQEFHDVAVGSNASAASVPEPAAITLMALLGVGLVAVRRRLVP